MPLYGPTTDVFVGDIHLIQIDTDETLTGLDLYIKFKRPDGTTGVWSATINGSDATIAEYTTDASDLNQKGVWKLQVFSSGVSSRSHGRVVGFPVYEPLRANLTTLAPTTLAPTTPVP